MKIIMLLFFSLLACSLLSQRARGFMPAAIRARAQACLTALFHAPAGFTFALWPDVITLANAKAESPIRVVRRSPAQQAAFLGRIHAIEADLFAPADLGTGCRPGEIYAANASRFDESFMHTELTDYAVGWRDPNNIEATVDFFAPRVQVSGPLFEYKEAINAEEFYSDGSNDDLRALGANYKIIAPYTGVVTAAKTEDRGLTSIIDLRTKRGQTNWEQREVEKIMRRLHRNRLRRAIALISAAATNTAKTWDTSAGKDPDMDVINEGITARTASGVGFNRIGFGDTAWAKRLLSLRAQNLIGQGNSAGMTTDELAGLLQIDKIVVSKERYQSASATKTEIVSNLLLMFMALDNADPEDPSNIKTFVCPTEGTAGFFLVFFQQISAKLVAITVAFEELQKVTSTLGIRKFTIS